MNIDEHIREAKPFHKALPIDIQSFKERVVSAAQERARGSVHTRKPRSLLKQPILLTTSVAVAAGLFGFAAAESHWFGVNVTMDSTGGDIATLQTPLESWTNTIQQWHINSALTLQEARSMAGYPIREPNQMTDWNLVQSFGFKTQVTSRNDYGKVTHSTGPIQFLDFWTNPSGQKVSVQQHVSPVDSGGTNLHFPARSYQVDSFKPDLAVVMDLQKGRMELAVYHVENDKKVSELDFYGTTSPETLESFAKAYLQAPSN